MIKLLNSDEGRYLTNKLRTLIRDIDSKSIKQIYYDEANSILKINKNENLLEFDKGDIEIQLPNIDGIVVKSSTSPSENTCLWIDDSVADNPILKIYNNGEWNVIGGYSTVDFVIDDSMSDSSSNLVSNKVIKKYVDDTTYKINQISYAQKTVNTELDYGVFEIKDMEINSSQPVIFSHIVDGNMELNENGFIKLKSGKTYIFHINLYEIPYNVAVYLVDTSLNILNQKGTSANTSFIYNCKEDIDVSITTTNSQTIRSEWGYVNVQEISRQMVVDPLEYVNTTQGIEDSPVGSLISHLGTIAPIHYLICDGMEYNITDYPYLAQHIESNFGIVNYFGGDGLLTFCVPDLKEKFLKGSETSGIYEEAGLPNITADWKSEPSASANGAVYITAEKGTLEAVSSGGSSDNRVHFDASLVNPIYGKSETVTPSNISVLFCIKYEPTYYAVVKRETTQEDIALLEETVELLTRENTLLQHELNSLEAIMEAINRRQVEKEESENEDGSL